jgi:hypothetical protein
VDSLVTLAERAATVGERAAAETLARYLRRILGTQAAVRRGATGRRSAVPGSATARPVYPASPGAPPRRVTGGLQSSVAVVPLSGGGLAVRVAFPSPALERRGHPHVGIAVAQASAIAGAAARQAMRGA